MEKSLKLCFLRYYPNMSYFCLTAVAYYALLEKARVDIFLTGTERTRV